MPPLAPTRQGRLQTPMFSHHSTSGNFFWACHPICKDSRWRKRKRGRERKVCALGDVGNQGTHCWHVWSVRHPERRCVEGITVVILSKWSKLHWAGVWVLPSMRRICSELCFASGQCRVSAWTRHSHVRLALFVSTATSLRTWWVAIWSCSPAPRKIFPAWNSPPSSAGRCTLTFPHTLLGEAIPSHTCLETLQKATTPISFICQYSPSNLPNAWHIHDDQNLVNV